MSAMDKRGRNVLKWEQLEGWGESMNNFVDRKEGLGNSEVCSGGNNRERSPDEGLRSFFWCVDGVNE